MNTSSHLRPHSVAAFTLIELLAVMAVIGVLAAIGLARLPNHRVHLHVAHDQLVGHLQFTQTRALADIEAWRLEFVSPSNYRILDPAGNAQAGLSSGGGGGVIALPSGVSLTTTPAVRFDPWGRPVDAAGTPLTANLNLTLQAGGQSRVITLLPTTGYIP